MSVDPYDVVLDHLDVPHRNGDNTAMARCPAHEDRNPSLSVTRGDDKVLLHCHAGCSVESILTAAGMSTSDLFATKMEPRFNTTRRIEAARYRYTDAEGTHLFDVVRTDPKGFHQEPASGKRGRGSMANVPMVLYRLPELIEVVAAGLTAYIGEGEKDADALTAAGYMATCNPMGAGKWAKVADHARQVLAGANVIIVADKDVAGYAHARDVARSLLSTAATITVVEATVGKDAADHLGAGRTVDDFDVIASNHTDISEAQDIAEWLGEAPGAVDLAADAWQVTDLGPAWNGDRPAPIAAVLERTDGVHLFLPGINYEFGDSGDGKSCIAKIASLQAIRAGHHVIWVTYEDPNEDEVVSRMKALGATWDEITRLHVVIATEPLTSGIGWFGRLARRTGAVLLVLDSVGEALAVDGIDEDRDADFGPWARQTLRHLIDICADVAWEHADGTAPNPTLAVIPIDHSTKAKDNPFYPSGTKRKRAMVTGMMVALNVRQPFARDQIGRVQLICSKDRSGRFRRGEIVAEITMDATTMPYTVYVDPPPTGAAMVTGRKRKAEDRILQVLDQSAGPLGVSEIHRLVNDEMTRLPGEGEVVLGTVKNTMTKLAERRTVAAHRIASEHGKAFHIRYELEDPEPVTNVTATTAIEGS